MTCPRHSTRPNGACAVCRNAVIGAFAKQILHLGPRTKTQYAALLDATRMSAPWFQSSMCSERIIVTANDNDDDEFAVHSVYALARDIARVNTTFAPVADVVPHHLHQDFLAYAETPASSVFVIFARGDAGTSAHPLVRTKTSHNAYDRLSMLSALRAAGERGISRSVLAAEYELAYLDLDTLSPHDVYLTAEHAWHRSVAVARTPGILETMQARNVVDI